MPSDFTIIFSIRQRFGNNVTDVIGGLPEIDTELNATFVGTEKEYTFLCPNVKTNENGILVFQSLGVSWRHEITINDKIVYGGLTRDAVGVNVGSLFNDSDGSNFWDLVSYPILVWNTHSLLISKNVLKTTNTLKIRSQPRADGGIDDFIIDNCLLHFKIN